MWRFFIQAAICDMLNTSTYGVHYETKIKVCCHCCYCYSSDSITGSGAAKSTILPTTVIESATHARVVSMLTFEHHDGQVFLLLKKLLNISTAE
ncbi:hypothetical protein [Escherichia coli]|uniref:hypothetical protein n=1 Tax=Escherichia coli TaxID=562 RepID=UPI00203407B0|nr:hypothetical protein [Escherichia coli]MBB2646251.1 hypothetical protein [Escherichia coli]